jgi:hypothetical protein
MIVAVLMKQSQHTWLGAASDSLKMQANERNCSWEIEGTLSLIHGSI